MQLEELNNKINDYIVELKLWYDEEGSNVTWDDIALETNEVFKEHGLTLTGNAARKRFKRNYGGLDDKPPVVHKNVPELDTVVLDRTSDVTSQLIKMFFG